MAVVNEQVTDSVTQVNTQVVGDTPAMAVGNLMVATGNGLSNAAFDASNSQQQSTMVMQTATVQGINSLFSVGTAIVGRSTEGILKKPAPAA
ncbi:RebB family R body protein [Photobacterium lipolyticum]|uniref:Glycerol-3-phosphate dehydrogenase subunit C n=1 Tax=Photobacterium lipolyticum TaxID=266810 RepID=A0A2T3N3W5_9GAMM|nr:RebB family R body protein [Photobacterium lipolyticum]PSW07156.1 glycerol-3-phosphate dehydrogenase subunit C [Photobacterium lipolyticum]